MEPDTKTIVIENIAATPKSADLDKDNNNSNNNNNYKNVATTSLKTIAQMTSTPHVYANVIRNDVDEQTTGNRLAVSSKRFSVGGVSNILPHIRVTSPTLTSGHLASNTGSSCPRSYSEYNLTTRSIRDVVDVSEGVTISYHDIIYSIDSMPTPMDALKDCCSDTSVYAPPRDRIGYKRILKGVSGIFQPGLNAIMGPSGCGKTSLLEIISGRKEGNKFCGTRLVNAQPMGINFCQLTGFTTQDEVLNPNLTVYEHLYYSLIMRFHGSLSKVEVESRLKEVVTDLGLSSCQNVKVGDWSNRTISGGERKRAAIAMELVSSPKILYLDEPTSKLDSTTSLSIVRLLKRLSSNGRTVIFTIHQPSYAIYRLFDTLTLIAKGRTIYHGLAANALEYFADIGHQCEKQNSPPDFFIDLLFGSPTTTAPPSALVTPRTRSTSLRRSAIRNQRMALSPSDVFASDLISGNSPTAFSNALDVTTAEGAKEHAGMAKRLNQAYVASQLYKENRVKLKQLKTKRAAAFATNPCSKQTSPFFREWSILTRRTISCSVRTFAALTLMNLLIGVIFAVLYHKKDEQASVQNRLGMFYYLSVHGVVVPAMITAESFFVNEKRLFIHERKAGMYRTSSYFLSQVLFIVLCRITSALLFSSVVYWPTGLRAEALAFLNFLWTAFSSGLTCDALCLLVGVAFKSFNSARSFVVLYMTLTSVFAGYLLNLDSAFKWLEWIKYISVTRYCYLSWVLNEFSPHSTTPCPEMTNPERESRAIEIKSRITNFDRSGRSRVEVTECSFVPSDSVLPQVVGNDVYLLERPWLNNVVLIVMATVLFTVGYLRMRKL